MSAPRRASVSVNPLAINGAQPILTGNAPTSPTLMAQSPPGLGASFGSPPIYNGSDLARSRNSVSQATNQFPNQQVGKALAPFPVKDTPVKVLLLENVNTAAVELLKAQGYHVEEIKKALGEDELINKLKEGQFQAVGIRSKTKVTAKVIKECPQVSRRRSQQRLRHPPSAR